MKSITFRDNGLDVTVSACVAEWIEIWRYCTRCPRAFVSACVAEWIEIVVTGSDLDEVERLRLCGGVD